MKHQKEKFLNETPTFSSLTWPCQINYENLISSLPLPELIKMLVQNGSDLNATMDVYNGQFTLKELIATSAHPHDAGIRELVMETIDNLSGPPN